MEKTHETVRVITDGQKGDLIATMIGAMPSLDFDQAQAIIGNKGPLVAGIRAAFKPYLRSIPADSVEFSLTIESMIDPLEMVRADGDDPKGWTFRGSQVSPRTGRFKLIRLWDSGIDSVCRQLKEYGSIPQGQWREAFKEAYPQNDGKGYIGFADPSWDDSNHYGNLPFLNAGTGAWVSGFIWCGRERFGNWRWLVEVTK